MKKNRKKDVQLRIFGSVPGKPLYVSLRSVLELCLTKPKYSGVKNKAGLKDLLEEYDIPIVKNELHSDMDFRKVREVHECISMNDFIRLFKYHPKITATL